MGYNFPDAPGLGQLFTPPGGPTWTWSNGAWVQTEAVEPALIGAQYFESVAQASASPIDPSLEVVHLTGYYNAGDGGSAMYKRTALTPTHQSWFTSADGALWELVSEGGECTFEQFGGIGDAVNAVNPSGVGTDNIPAWNRAMLFVTHAVSVPTDGTLSPAMPRLKFQQKCYYFSAPFDVRANVHIMGRATGQTGRFGGTRFHFPPDCAGVRIQHWNTEGSSGPAIPGNPYKSGQGSLIEGINVFQSGTDPNAHGFQMRVTAVFRKCAAFFSPGHGFCIEAFNGSTTMYGNVNNWIMEDCYGHEILRDYLHVAGGDAQQGRNYNFTTHGIARLTGGCGIYDQSWIGCTHVGPQITGYGNCGVHRDGHHYLLIAFPPQGGEWEPGTNDAVWYPLRAGGVIAGRYPEWVEGGDYKLSLPWFIANSNSTIYNPYVEGGTPGHGGNTFGGNASATNFTNRLVNGGNGSNVPVTSTRGGIGANRTFVAGKKGYDKNGTTLYAYVGTADGHDDTGMNILEHSRSTDGLYTYKYQPGAMVYSAFLQKLVYHVSTSLTTELYGRPWTPVPQTISFVDYALRDPGSTLNWRIHGIRAAIPTGAGEYARGELRWNVAPTAGGKVGWVCTTGGALASVWVTSTNYALNGYIKTGAGRFYKCTLDPTVIVSTIEPVHTTGTVVSGDGYGWDYLTIEDPTPAWVTGTQYPVDSIIRNTTMKVYRCLAAPVDPSTGLLMPSTVQPTHATGTVTTTDDYRWTFVEQLWFSSTNYALNDIVKTAAGRSYMVSTDPPGAPLSVNEPSHMLEQVVGADGYGWTYVSTGAASLSKAWLSGRNYALNDLVKNSVGRTYTCVTDPGTLVKSTIEPVHTSGLVTSADGYRWSYVETLWQAGVDYAAAAAVKNSAGHTYSCTVDPGAGLSANEPVHSRHKVYPDGYGWTYITSTEAVWKPFGAIDP